MSKKVYELYNDDLAKALKARQDFLDSLCGEKKEQALAMQKRMSTRLKSAGCVNNRLVLINQMMFDKLRELGSELKKLNTRLTEDIKEEENLQEETYYGIKERKRET